MKTRGRMVLLFAVAATSSPFALRAQNQAQLKARMSIVGLDITSADMLSYCETGAPAAAPALRTVWRAWRVRNRVEDITRSLDAAMLQKTRDAVSPIVAAAHQKIAGAGQPTAVCPQLASMWSSEAFDVQRLYPAAFDASGNVDASAVTARPVAPQTVTAPPVAATPTTVASGSAAPQPRRPFNPQKYSTVARPIGTVYTVAQLTPLVASWLGTPRDYTRARAAARNAGTIYIRGTVVARGEDHYLASSDGTFASRLAVEPSIDISAFEGQEITLEGTLEEVPIALVFLETARVVRDPSGLSASPLSQDTGLKRLAVTRDRITAVAGRGLRASDIHGMLYTTYKTSGVNGFEFREELRLLLRDGWAYLRDDMPPADLDVAVSRRIEPQRWARWRAVSGGYEIQERDDNGQPDGNWSRITGSLLPTWPANQRVNGNYTASSFRGSIALGGSYSRTTFAFKPDGRWERIGFSESGSGTMAAQAPVSFSASAASSSDGSGTKSTAGGGNDGVYASSSSRRDDGAGNRGTYRLDGMTIELRADDGTVTRTLCVPTDAKFESLYLFGRSFSRK